MKCVPLLAAALCTLLPTVASSTPYALSFRATVAEVSGLAQGENGPALGSEIKGFMRFGDHDLDEFPDDYLKGEYYSFDAGIEMVGLYYDPYLAGVLTVDVADESIKFKIYDGWPGSHYQFELKFKAPGLLSDRFPSGNNNLSLASITGSYMGQANKVNIDLTPLFLSLAPLSAAPEPSSPILFLGGLGLCYGILRRQQQGKASPSLQSSA